MKYALDARRARGPVPVRPQEFARVYAVDALKRWEPRVAVTGVQISREEHDGENALAIRLRYDVISTNTPGNNVIIASIEQILVL